MKVCAFFFFVAVTLHQMSQVYSTYCRDGATECDGCQCCPDGRLCPGATGCPFKCPKDLQDLDKPGFCRDGSTRCDGCQCCPDGRLCPGGANCPFKCPKDAEESQGVCRDGATSCDGCQCCPDGRMCPKNAGGCPFKCPKDDSAEPTKPGFCRDGATRCEGCQCCPDGSLCPGASGCPFKCPKDSDQPSPDKPGFCRDGATRCEGCQCCPDGKSCPGSSGCPSKCPNDDQIPKTVATQTTKSTTPRTTPRTTTMRTTSTTTMRTTSTTTRKTPVIPAHRITFSNQCPRNIWVGAFNTPGKQVLEKSGWLMEPDGPTYTLSVPAEWSGRFWGRTGCAQASHGQFVCITGDCARQFECNGTSATPPVTVAEFTFDSPEGVDFYDVSLIDGYNLPIMIKPVDDSYIPDSGNCKPCGCNKDLNLFCLTDLRLNYNGETVGCKSPCAATNEDRYCCRGIYNCRPEDECGRGKKACSPANWPINYSQIFKIACPAAYTYVYDSAWNTFSCAGNPYTHYEVIFCP